MKLVLSAELARTPLLSNGNEPVKRLNEGAAVLWEGMATPDKCIPNKLQEKAHCIASVPGPKTERQDLDDHQELYGKRLENKQIVMTKVKAPRSALPFISLLNKDSSREQKSASSSLRK